jgi:hypothetical protein
MLNIKWFKVPETKLEFCVIGKYKKVIGDVIPVDDKWCAMCTFLLFTQEGLQTKDEAKAAVEYELNKFYAEITSTCVDDPNVYLE